MTNQILVPSLGESVTEATVSKWLKQVGDKVDSDEPLVELETDKVNIEVPSPQEGSLSSIKVKEGTTVEVGSLLGIINEGKSDSTKLDNSNEKSEIQKTSLKKDSENSKKIKKNNLKKPKTLKLVNQEKDESKKEKPLILSTLADIKNSEENLINGD